ncbi:DNA/RNA nuclease SfsA [Thermincola potens]|uniref:Sugar fermentation stimulation protein homolog n=1 Tax=Thermincola potens (strain JR) TaxID=635013 RepID=D5X9B8_THEPJ|nr:DNA/RNA nuclease SfsA [Thermincola potens]ADG83022.1 sugar fermentation stimulation protein [Thermincola potens JR]
MRLPALVEGIFLQRTSRFSALVLVREKKEKVYVPNSGRMQELLTAGGRVYLAESPKAERTTKYDLLLVDFHGTLVSVDSRVPNLIIMEALKKGNLPFWQGQELTDLKKEATFGKSRFDFKVSVDAGRGRWEETFIEAKSVTLVKGNTAMFPDAPTERGSKHLQELVQAVRQGLRGMVIFVVQRPDAETFAPNAETDPLFAENLQLAAECGVELHAFRCVVQKTQIVLEREIPVLGG